MDTPAAATSSQPQNDLIPQSGWKQKIKKHKKLVIGSGVILVILTGLIIFLLQGNGMLGGDYSGSANRGGRTDDSGFPSSGSGGASGEKPENAIARVGEEYIFQRDLDYELTFQPGAKTDELKKMLVQKLVNDSIALQAAQKEKLATAEGKPIILNSSEFNVEAKDYQSRYTKLNAIRKTVDTRIDRISGTMVSVWFYNMKPALIGLEKGKQEALRRITALHQKVVNKEMTIEQAGNSIKSDPSYADLDLGYMNNALYEFNFPKGKRITFDQGYDDILWKTKPGEITDVYLAKTVNEFTNKEEESYYIFALVKEKSDNGNGLDFDKWVEDQKKNYEISIY